MVAGIPRLRGVITRTNRPLSLRPLGMRSKTPIGRSGSGLRWGPCPEGPRGTRGSIVGEVSALDLIYTTRYGAARCCTGAAGHLSICQWSRILTIASLRGTTALQAPGHAGIGNLGFGAPAKSPDSAGGPGDGGPIVMISPFTEHSAVWTWRPEPGICAFARVPRELAEDDKAASRFGSVIDTAAPPGPATDPNPRSPTVLHRVSTTPWRCFTLWKWRVENSRKQAR